MPRHAETILTESMCAEVEEKLAKGCFLQTAAAFVGVSMSAFHRWLTAGSREERERRRGKAPDGSKSLCVLFARSVKRGLARCELAYVEVIEEAATKGKTWQAAAWMLERRFAGRWGKDAGTMQAALKEVEELKAQFARVTREAV